MVKMRPEQMEAFRIERVLPAVYDDLLASNVLTNSRVAAGLPASPEPNPTPAIQSAEAAFRSGVLSSLRHDIRRAIPAGINSYHGLLLFSSFRFTVGPTWFERAAILAILDRPQLTEQERLDAIYSALNGF